MANLAAAYVDARTMHESAVKFWDEYAYDHSSDLGAGAALLEEVAARATLAAADLRAADKALAKSRA